MSGKSAENNFTGSFSNSSLHCSSVWDWKDGTKLSSLSPSQNNFATNIASVKFLNPRREDLLLTGTGNKDLPVLTSVAASLVL